MKNSQLRCFSLLWRRLQSALIPITDCASESCKEVSVVRRRNLEIYAVSYAVNYAVIAKKGMSASPTRLTLAK